MRRLIVEELLRSLHHAPVEAEGPGRIAAPGFTRLLKKTFNHENWPVVIVQSSGGGLQYYADPIVAAAWTTGTP